MNVLDGWLVDQNNDNIEMMHSGRQQVTGEGQSVGSVGERNTRMSLRFFSPVTQMGIDIGKVFASTLGLRSNHF